MMSKTISRLYVLCPLASNDCKPSYNNVSMTTAHLHRVIEIFLVSLRLGLTSFGGPIAHLGYFRNEYVVRRKWLDERSYAEVVALRQVLPGPASSQVGMSIGMMRAGLLGSVAAWLGFTLPSALVMIAFAYGVTSLDAADAGWLHGLKIVAVAVVAQAVWGMSRTLTPDRLRIIMAMLATVAMLVFAAAWAQIVIIFAAALVGVGLLRSGAAVAGSPLNIPVSRRAGILALLALVVMLIALPLLRPGGNEPCRCRFRRFLPSRLAGLRRRPRSAAYA